MKILHVYRVSPSEQHGGVQRSIVDLAAATDPERVQHELFALADDGPWKTYGQHANLTVHAARRSGVFLNCDYSVNAARQFRGLAAQADVINYHLPWPFVQALDRHVPSGKPRIATYHADICRYPWAEFFYRPFLVRFLQRLDGVICTSETYKESSRILRNLPSCQVHAAELGIGLPDLNQQVLDFHLNDVVERFGKERFMLFLGATRRYKGVEIAIEALLYTDSRLVIAGHSPSYVKLMSKARALGVADRVVFLGSVDEEQKWALIRQCAALVMPSTLRSEAFGLALVEAAAAGRPAITCEIGTATTYVVRDGETGLVVPPKNAICLGQAMQRLFSDIQFAEALGRAANLRYREHFTAEAYAMRIQGIYDSLITEQGSINSRGKEPITERVLDAEN